MNYEFICAYCKTSFVPKRTDAKYCSDRCRYKNAHLKRLEKAFLADKEKRKFEILLAIDKLKAKEKSNQQNLEVYRDQKKSLNAWKASYEKIKKAPLQEVFSSYVQQELKKVHPNSPLRTNLEVYYNVMQLEEKKEVISNYLKGVEERIKVASKKFARLEDKQLIWLLDTFSFDTRLAELEKQIAEIEQETFKPPVLPLASNTSSSPKRKSKPKRLHPKEFGAKDVLNLNFKTFVLPGELGRFLGELDRNMLAFALTGDSGAGKTYLSFALAKLFITSGMKVKYFSLEEGIGKLTQQKITFYELGNNLKMSAEGTLDDIRSDANYFDVIIVDSYSKLTTKPEEFEELRQDFPQTIFIIIFQKTTSGTIRGGASIKYNSSATIDVVSRDGRPISIMKKSRYGTQNWEYDNKSGQIIKES